MECNFKNDSFLTRWRKKRAIRRYVHKLGPKLAQREGKKRYYTPAEIQRTAQANNYPMDYFCYSIATYSSPSDFQTYHSVRGETCDYEAMRSEIGEVCFNGRDDFTILDILGTSHTGSWISDFFSGESGGGDSSNFSDSGGGDFGCGSDGGD